MILPLNLPSPLQQIDHLLFTTNKQNIYVKRDDLIHEEISGNKWRKLKYNLEKFKAGKYDSILTFGGAFSNHIAATAAAAKLLQIPAIGIIRGDELHETSNHTLDKAQKDGMKLVFVSREDYRQRYERIYHEALRRIYGNVLIIEEGGANYLGAQGVSDLVSELPFEPDMMYTACGTGTTAAGLLLGTKKTQIVAVTVLKNGDFLKEDIRKLLSLSLFDEELVDETMRRLTIESNYHFGGYGKYTAELLDFMSHWTLKTGIPLDQVYTAKMMYAFERHLENGQIPSPSKTVLLHTGGLQGILQG